MLLFKPLVSKVILSQTTGWFNVITPFKKMHFITMISQRSLRTEYCFFLGEILE